MATIDVSRVPSGISTLALVVSLDDSVPGSLAAITNLGATLGQVSAPALGLTSERAAVMAEIYRRGDQRKIRNVSNRMGKRPQGFVTSHGVSVHDAPSRPSAPTTTLPFCHFAAAYRNLVPLQRVPLSKSPARELAPPPPSPKTINKRRCGST
ncbi:hypothetical protein ACFVWF_28395 [Rhodococcus qingshengii]|uniref:hypothetical protein n=1 Tax=Rhodococcus qingshengii TaxID=334542 RepID=UPI0036DB4140